MKSKRRKAFLVSMAIILTLGIQSTPVPGDLGFNHQVYAASNVSASLVGNPVATQGDEDVNVNIKITNSSSSDITITQSKLDLISSDGVTISGDSTSSFVIPANGSATTFFTLDISKTAAVGTRTITLTLKSNSSTEFDGQIGKLTIYEKLATPGNGAGGYIAAIDISHSINPSGGFAPNADNKLSLEFFNAGNTLVKNAQVSLTLPDGLSVNNGSNTSSLGYLSIGSTKKISFPIYVGSEAESKNYAVTVELSGLDYNDKSVSVKKTFYIPVNGTGTSSTQNIEITNINTPNQVLTQEDFKLSFNVENRNSAVVKNFKVTVEVPEGIINKTRNTFIESSIPAGGSKNYSVTLFADSGAKPKAYPIKITVEPVSSKAAEGNIAMQYASVYVKGSGNTKTPQLMVDRYGYGGTFVQAGDKFVLDLGLYNTSSSYTLTNIKVTLTTEDGSFIPVNSSNSFFIEDLKPKGHIKESVVLATKPNAEQKTTALTVDMAYEDGAGNAFTSKDVISIPIMQETRLVVDDVIAPPELYAMMQTGVSVQFYNMGKTVLSNLRVNVEGDFDAPQSNSYYVGNLEGGKSDSYDFTFIPRKGGTMEGKLIFTYEDASGEEQVLEKPFAFEVMDEAPPMPDDGMMPDENPDKGGKKWPWVVGGLVVVNTGLGIFLWKRHKKKKINQEMEIDE